MPDKTPTHRSAPDRNTDQPESTLLPMLIAGLVLVVVGAVIIMSFV